MLKLITSAPGFALASRMACRREPAPLSLVLVTWNVADGVCSFCPASFCPGMITARTVDSDSSRVAEPGLSAMLFSAETGGGGSGGLVGGNCGGELDTDPCGELVGAGTC